MEIRDWWIARELDVRAMQYIYEQELEREFDREQRDREFWISMFGGSSSEENELPVSQHEIPLEDMMSRSVLGQR